MTSRFGGRQRVQIPDVLQNGSRRRGMCPRQAGDQDQ
jgi:hypothetical protein